MWRLTRQEQWAVFVAALVLLGSVAGRAWLGARTGPGPAPAAAGPTP